MATSSCATMPAKAAFRPGISNTGCRSRPNVTVKFCACSSRRPRRRTARTVKRILALAARYTGLRHPNRREAPAFKAELKAIGGSTEIITRGLSAYRAGPDRAAPTLALHHLLERQHYKLGHWRLASSDINYRRFFDVNTLAGLRVEDAGTFDAIHTLVKKLIVEGKLQGLRLDHIDGLRDPAQYFQRLRRLVRDAQGGHPRPFYTVIEKILGEDEKLPKFRGVHGTTGYEWMNVMTQVLIDGNGLAPWTRSGARSATNRQNWSRCCWTPNGACWKPCSPANSPC